MTGERLTAKEGDPGVLPFTVTLLRLNGRGGGVTVLEPECLEQPAAITEHIIIRPDKRIILSFIYMCGNCFLR